MSDWSPNDPDAVNVHYDLSSWTPDQEAELIEALAEGEIPHTWDGTELVVPEEVEGEVDALFEVLEARLGIESADGTVTEVETSEPIEADEQLTEYELEEWSVADRAVLTEALVASRVPHRWEDGLLLVPTDAEDAVEELMNDIESGQVWIVPEGDEDDGYSTGEDPSDVLLVFKSAGERLARNPLDADGLEALLAALEAADPDRPLPGIVPATWREICALAEDIADALAGSDTPDEPMVIDSAERLSTAVDNLL